MVLKLVSHDGGLEIVSVTYNLTIIDRCCDICYNTIYQNTSSIPITLKIEYDNSIDLGILYCLESTIGGIGVFDQSSKSYPLQLSPSSSPILSTRSPHHHHQNQQQNFNDTSIDLLPGKEILFNARYASVLSCAAEKYIKLDIPFHPYSSIASVDFRVEGEFSSNVKNIKSKSHASSLDTITIEDNKLSSIHRISNNNNLNDVQHFIADIELQEIKIVSGWYANTLNHEGKHFKACMVMFNIDRDAMIGVESGCIEWSDQTGQITKVDRITNSNAVFYNIESSQAAIESTNIAHVKYNLTNTPTIPTECNIHLLSTSTLLIYRFSTLSKLNIIHNDHYKFNNINQQQQQQQKQNILLNNNNNDNNNNNQSNDISFLIKLFLDNTTIKSTDSPSSPLSMSAPVPNNNSNDDSSNPSSSNLLLRSSDLLSNISSHPNKVRPPGLQAFTAPPTFVKDLQANPIAAFVANAKQGPSALTGPKRTRGPPMLGGSDIRLQRLASYNKVNNMWNLSMSDFTDRHTIGVDELEATALDLALNHVRVNWWSRGRLASMREIQALRTAVQSIVVSSKIDLTYVEVPIPSSGSSKMEMGVNGSSKDLSMLLNRHNQGLGASASLDNAEHQTDSQSTGIVGEAQQRKEKVIDIVKLKWVIEEMLDNEKQVFPRDDDAKIRTDAWFHLDVAETRGERGHMEDKHIVIENANSYFGLPVSDNEKNQELFVGVFDGHNGKLASDFTKTHLPYEIYRARNTMSSPVEECLSKAYCEVDRKFLQLAEREEKKAGTTAATVIASRDRLLVSNVGDTEVVLSSGGSALPLSTMHNPSNQVERERVERAGGVIIQCGTLRVNGILAVTRSFGDRNLKDVITAAPDTTVHRLASTDQFIVMATDGLWDVFKHQEVVDFIIQQNNQQQQQQQQNNLTTTTTTNNTDNGQQLSMSSNPPPSIADKLIEEALKRHSNDNITVAIIYFKDNFKPY